MPISRFIEGPAGVGKTTFGIQYVRDLLQQGVAPQHILILVPQRALGHPYQVEFASDTWPPGTSIDVLTLAGLARRGIEAFWPQIADQTGFEHPEWEPVFLTIETAQYYMARLVGEAVKTGVFDSISVTPFGIMRQTLDNLSKAAVNRFSLDEVVERLVAAWGDRHSSRPPVYRACIDVARQFRQACEQNSLLDFSLQIEFFFDFLLHDSLYRDYFVNRYRHLVADNIEEGFPAVHDFLDWAWEDLDSVLLLYDQDAGYRVFLGADPGGMYDLAKRCDTVQVWDTPVTIPANMIALAEEFDSLLSTQENGPSAPLDANPCAALDVEFSRFYPQMLEEVVLDVASLAESGVSLREIVVLAPFLGDSLRFMLTTQLAEHGIASVSHRPSRAVRDEPAARAVLTLMALAHPQWGYMPPVADVADAFYQAIIGLDPVRAWLLARIVYRPGYDALGSFEQIEAGARERITYVAGARYEALRRWIGDYVPEATLTPPDLFISRLFGEILSQPEYGFHSNLDAGRAVAELVESARKFRQTLYPYAAQVEDWTPVGREYYGLVQDGLLAALYVASWRDEQQDAVFIAPAYTFLMRNRTVDYQFWLDVGSNHWWERLEQPLTHPFVLARSYPRGQMWTDNMEFLARQEALRKLMLGLTRRCRRNIYAYISNLGEGGYEQRGPLLQVFQSIMQRYSTPEDIS